MATTQNMGGRVAGWLQSRLRRFASGGVQYNRRKVTTNVTDCFGKEGVMSIPVRYPTPYPDVNAILNRVLEGVQAILGDEFIGMALYGSLAYNDFHPQRSDIDFLVVTADTLADEKVAALKALHEDICASESRWANELEGSYIPKQALRRYDPAQARHPHIGRGEGLRIEQHDSDWVIQRHVLRERGVVLAGPALDTLIDPVQPDELRHAVLKTLHGWWKPMLEDTQRLLYAGYQAYAVMTMGRILYTLHTGAIASKSVAGRWAQTILRSDQAALIEAALTWENGMPFEHLDETVALIRYTLEQHPLEIIGN